MQRLVSVKAQAMLDYFFYIPKDRDILDSLKLLTSEPLKDKDTEETKARLVPVNFVSLEQAHKDDVETIKKYARVLAGIFSSRLSADICTHSSVGNR